MHRLSRWWLAAFVPVAVASLLLLTGVAVGSQASPLPRKTAAPAGTVAATPIGAPPAAVAEVTVHAVVAYTNAVALGDYVHAVQMAAVTDYVNAVAQANAQAQSAPRYSAPQQSSGSIGDCTGFSIPSWIIQRESGGNPNAVNPSSGAYGCSQTLPEHYQSGGACAGLNMYSVDGQRQCTNILSNGGTNLAPWAE